MVATSKSQIHYFSRNFTGIKWSAKHQRYVTEGFDKEIANSDTEVPQVIREAVNNDKFRINDNYPPLIDDIALMGREISDYVILVVATSAIDDGNRPLVAYQYYWKEKKDDHEDVLSQLLDWWDSQGQPCSKLSPIENYGRTNKRRINQKWLDKFYKSITVKPFIFDGENCQQQSFPTVRELHELAKKLNQDYNIPISWAWNVTSLDCPESFSLICCADRDAYQWITTNNKTFTPIQRAIPQLDRGMSQPKSFLKNALNSIAKNSKLEYNLTLIAEQLEKENSYNWSWEMILDNNVLKNYQDSGGIRYRAMLLLLMPLKNLDEHIKWLTQKGNKKNREQLIIIQQKLLEIIQKNALEKAEEYFHLNCDNVLKKLLMLVILPEENNKNQSIKIKQWTKWLLIYSESLWQEKFQEYGEKLLENILSLDKSLEKDDLFQEIIKEIKKIRKDRQKSIKRYEFLAELFALNQQYILASLFYQISLGEVPKDIYQRCELKTIIPLEKSDQSSGLIQLWLKNTKESLKNWLLFPFSIRIKNRKRSNRNGRRRR